FLLNVPVYQRPFAWGREEAGQLLDDIIESAGLDSENAPAPNYFLGAVLLMDTSGGAPVRLGTDMAPREFDIVDGQQRLVTLLTLIAVLRDLEANPRGPIAARAAGMISAQQNSGFFRAERQRIHLASRERAFFETYVLEPGAVLLTPKEPPQGPEEAIHDVREHFVAELTEYSPAERARLFDYVTEHCEVVVIISDDIDRAYRMFIVLNERGKGLQRNDILKADVINRLNSGDVDWGVKAWDETSVQLGGDFETFFSHLRTIYGHTRPQIVSAVRAVMREEGGAAPFIKNALLPLAGTFAAIRGEGGDSEAMVSPRMRWHLHYLNRLPDGDWAPAAMLALRNRRDDPAASERLLSEIDRMAHLLRLLCLGTGRRKRRFADIVSAIRSNEALRPGGHPAFAVSRDEVRNIAFHLKDLHKRNQKMCKLLLMRLNDEIAGAISIIDPEDYTIEHVLPQRPPNASEWRRWFPLTEERARCTESLGNLVLITQAQNDKARNALFSEKKRIFSDGPLLPITRDVLRCAEWHKFEIEAREEHLFDVLRRTWRIDLPPVRPIGGSETPPVAREQVG
ncbi:MAG: DUF262 domain-containing HNH endonuclease family protein, partial [Hyphomicrobium sp.]